MLSTTDNDALTRVGPGTMMGELMRRYWVPAILSRELEADGDTLRIRLLGEDLVAYRDSAGRVGVLGANCAHRGADLFLARNEESGLRCIYHGWKYDVTGACVDMPNEPEGTVFKQKVRQTAYPARERGGMVWVFMGAGDAPELPALEWNMLPEGQSYLKKRVQACNWLQALEGDIDQSHNSFLHTGADQLKPLDMSAERTQGAQLWRRLDKRPRFHVEETRYGVLIGAQRNAYDDLDYWRITHFMLPFHTIVGVYGDNPSRSARVWVPIDDYTTLVVGALYHPTQALSENELMRARENGGGAGFVADANFQPATTAPFGAWIPKASNENDFFFDRATQRTKYFSGIPEFWAQDGGVQIGMGPIYDRSREHLGTTDRAIIRTRKRLLDTARALADGGGAPPGVADVDIYRLRGAAMLLRKDADWVAAAEAHSEMIWGENQDAPPR